MDARWMPIVAAGIGLIGGLGGALIGGWLANEGQERRFEKERAAANREMRREAYGTYLGIAEEVIATDLAEGAKAEPSQDAINAVFVRLYPAGARIDLIAKSEAITDAADALREALLVEPSEQRSKTPKELQDEYKQASKDFLAAAHNELEGSGE